MNDYVCLHCHDEFSLLDGATTAERLAQRAAKLGMPALAISNHGVLGGCLRHYLVCQEVGIKPIFAMEGYVNNHRLKDIPGLIKKTKGTKEQEKWQKFKKEKFKPSPHFLILAKTEKGFKNLIKIANDAHANGSYYRPRTDIKFLANHCEGLVFSTACLGGHFARLLENNNTHQAKKDWYVLRDAIGDENLFIEIIPLSSDISIEANKRLITFSREVNAPILITGDAHFSKKRDALVQTVLMLMRQKKTLEQLKAGEAWGYDNRDLYFKSYQELKATWDQYYSWAPSRVFEEGMRNSLLIANKVEEFCPAKASIPTYTDNGRNANKQLVVQCKQRLKQLRLGSEYKQRLKRELSLIQSHKFSDYFLIYADVVQWAKQQNIRVGPGRGSAGGCLVAFLLGITEIDPITHDLLFERFLDPGRPDPPDIDVDFEPEKRDLVKQYIFDRFTHAATIGTYSRMQVKAVIKDVGRVFGCNAKKMNELTASLPFKSDDSSWQDLLKHSKLLRQWAKEYPEAFYIAGRLRGQISHQSKHAAGVVITKDPIEEVLPIHHDKGTKVVSWPDSDYYRELTRMGFLKWDVLGVSHLSIISRAIEYIKEVTGDIIDTNSLPLDDQQALALANDVNTDGIFQFGTPTAKRLLSVIGVDCFEDLVAITALGRPGPINAGYPIRYGKRKNNKESYTIYEPIRHVLQGTYGLIIYQEQIMKIGQILGGFTLKEINHFRKVIGKKRDPEELAPFKKRFIRGSCKQDISQEDAEQLWDDIKGFAEYGFNKSHATAYALIAYQELYLKARYPQEFMAALLTLAPDKKQAGEKIERQYLRAAFRMGLTIRPPHVNQSRSDYSFTPTLRMGLKFIKGIGSAAKEITDNAPYQSFDDFYERVNKRKVNKKVVEALIKSGALDSFADKGLPWKKRHQLRQRYYELRGMKDQLGEGSQSPSENLRSEAATIGSPLTSLALLRPLRASSELPALERIIDRENGILIGVVGKIKTCITKKGDEMAFVLIEDETATLDLTIWPEQWASLRDDIGIGDIISCRYRRQDSYNKRYGDYSYFITSKVRLTHELIAIRKRRM